MQVLNLCSLKFDRRSMTYVEIGPKREANG
jgi:hypothetical protein